MKLLRHSNSKIIIRSLSTALELSSPGKVPFLNSMNLDIGFQSSYTGKSDENCLRPNVYSDSLWDHFLSQKKYGNPIDSYTYARLLQRCVKTKSMSQGKIIHAHMITSGDEVDTFTWNTLLNMYAKNGFVEVARQVFDKMPERDLVSWTAMIGGYSQHDHAEEALRLFCEVLGEGLELNQYPFGCVLKACASLGMPEHGEQLLACIVKVGFETDVFVGSALVDMLAKCGCIEDASKVFNNILEPDMVSWTAMITGCAQNEYGEQATELFCQMLVAGMKPNQFTFASVLKACASLTALEEGRQVHAHIVKTRYSTDLFVGSALIDFYVNCGEMENALKLFDKMPERDMVSWTAMIARCAQNGQSQEALTIFREMQQAGVKPNQFTFASVLNACSSIEALEQGNQVHTYMIKFGWELDVFAGSALVDMYAKCGIIDAARNVFENLQDRNEVSWNTMIVGYVQLGYGEAALKLFCQMLQARMKPNQITLTSVLRAYASLAALEQGKHFHAYISRTLFQSDVCVGNALVDMYAKCGCIKDAHKAFDQMPKQDEVSWNTMIVGYAHHGHGKDAIQLFEKMQHEGVKPNNITFVGVLSACSRVGLVDEGCRYFDSMIRDYGIIPRMEHYSCMVNLLGRSGRLGEAEDFVKRMPVEPGPVVWRSLLGACRIHGNIELGEYAAKRALELEPQNDATHVLLSNLYAAAGRWNDVAEVRKLMDDKGLKKEPGLSWIEVKSRVHSFVVGDMSHPQLEEIHAKLNDLTLQMKELGYIPDTNFVLRDVEQEQKEHSLGHHSEKLAIAFGLISTPFGMPLRVIKNLRVCGDCHTAIKFISKIEGREIVVRDMKRFHHFESGLCSCGNFW
jgi:pentatricopeptide repeat protein